MKYFLLTLVASTFGLASYAEEQAEETTESAEKAAPPSYSECFDLTKQNLQKEMDNLQEQVNSGELPVTVERDGIDIRSLNPKVNPGTDDVKASLQIDLPTKKEEDAESISSQCYTLYGIKITP
jgi:hypothetical protein